LHIKPFLFFCFLTLINIVGEAQNTFIPDDNFEQALIDLGFDAGALDDFVPTANINTITNLDVSLHNISDLTGIEGFTALEALNCGGNQLTTLNVSQNTALTELFCDNNMLSVLDVTQNPDLKIFWCYFNQLSSLNVLQNPNLISLVCGDNQLNNLDVSQNLNLNVLACENNQLSALNVSNNSTLNRLQCGDNTISILDVSQNTNLTYLACENNLLISELSLENNSLLTHLYCQFNIIKVLDLSKNTALIALNYGHNNSCLLNLKNGNNNNIIEMDFDFNINLNCVVVDSPLGNHTNWLPNSFSGYISSENQCNNLVNIDVLSDVITSSYYTLPGLTFGKYFTSPSGNGTSLFAGENITSSQTIYIYNETVCNTNESSFTVTVIDDVDYFIPKYFTPNNDGSHDVWQVIDFTNSVQNIRVFDAYGKLLKSLQPSQSWNGIYRRKLMKTDDYWYVITLNTGEALKGHFTLKR